MNTQTIAAIATALSASGIGIVRLSGPEAIAIADTLFVSKKGKKLAQCASHTIHYGHIYQNDTLLDEVLVLLMKGPHSYTAEDIVEIDCHGGILVMQKILAACLSAGARLAEPGEFTKRAFLNGRIDLSQAESVADLIASKNAFSMENSLEHLQGRLLDQIKTLRSQILYELAFIETAIDDPEHISLDGYPQKLGLLVDNFVEEVDKLLRSSQNGALLKDGIDTVIVGCPNVGKSSLLNALVGKDRAIVTAIPGTTRDALEESVNLGGLTLNLVDTAGIRETTDLIEQMGVARSKDYLQKADLVLFVLDATGTTLDPQEEEILTLVEGKKVLYLRNKIDLLSLEETEPSRDQQSGLTLATALPISAKEHQGFDALEEAIRNLFFRGEISPKEEIFITNLRQLHALEEAKESLLMVRESIETGLPEDFYSIDLLNAYEVLGSITGETVGEDVINEIFSKFCMGK